jgi:hypothetical protein
MPPSTFSWIDETPAHKDSSTWFALPVKSGSSAAEGVWARYHARKRWLKSLNRPRPATATRKGGSPRPIASDVAQPDQSRGHHGCGDAPRPARATRPGNAAGRLLPGFVVGRAPGDLARAVDLAPPAGAQFRLAGLRGVLPHRTTPERSSRLPGTAPPGRTGHRAEYSDPGFILLGKALEGADGETLPSWTAARSFSRWHGSPLDSAPPADARPPFPPRKRTHTFRHRRIQGEVQDENAWVLNGVAGHAGLFSNVPDLLRFARAILSSRKTQTGPSKSPPLRPSRIETICPTATAPGQLARAGMGYAVAALRRPARHFSPAFHRASGLQRLLLMDRSGRGRRRCSADQPHLARSEEPIDPRGRPALSRRRPRRPFRTPFGFGVPWYRQNKFFSSCAFL